MKEIPERTHVSVGFYEKKREEETIKQIQTCSKGLKTSKVPTNAIAALSTTTTMKTKPCLFLAMFSSKPNSDHFQMHARCLCSSFIITSCTSYLFNAS